VEVAGQPVRSVADIGRALDAHKPGDTVKVKVVRGGGETTLDVTLATWPDDPRF
jgi:S1-C subfamily serine protease